MRGHQNYVNVDPYLAKSYPLLPSTLFLRAPEHRAKMSSARKRPRSETTEDSRAECPFTIRVVDPKEKEQKKKKRRRTDGEDDDGAQKMSLQLSPFTPTGRFKTYETMDLYYQVDPPKRWTDMTRYNSFVRK